MLTWQVYMYDLIYEISPDQFLQHEANESLAA